MRKVLFVLLAVIPLVFSGCGGIAEQKFMGISGKPKSVKETKYEAVEKFGEAVEQDIEDASYYEFNKDGHIQKIAVYDYDGDVIFSRTYKYENGKQVETNSFQKYNNILTTDVLKNRTSKSETWETTTSDGRTTTTNLEIGNQKTISVTKDSDGNTISKADIRFDKKRNLVEQKIYSENQVVYWVKSTFDDDSKEITKTILAGGDDGIYRYEYKEFDNKGNWTKRIEYLNEELGFVTMREIKY